MNLPKKKNSLVYLKQAFNDFKVLDLAACDDPVTMVIARMEIDKFIDCCRKIEADIKTGSEELMERALQELIMQNRLVEEGTPGRYKLRAINKLHRLRQMIEPWCVSKGRANLALAQNELKKDTADGILAAITIIDDFRHRLIQLIESEERTRLWQGYDQLERDIKKWLVKHEKEIFNPEGQ